MSRRPLLAAFLATALLALGASVLYKAGVRPPSLPPPPAAEPPVLSALPSFALTDASGRLVRSAELRGPWLADFIFTSCSGQCPTMTERMRSVGRRLPGLKLVSFSVDPEDTPERLSEFARRTGAGWLFLTGRPGEVRRLCREGFKLPVEDGGAGGEAILHSRYFVLVDGRGRVRGYYDSDDASAFERLARDAGALAGS